MLNEKQEKNVLENEETTKVLDIQNDTDAQENAKDKTFTQSEVDEIVKKRLARALKDYPEKEEIARLINLKDDLEGKDKEIASLKDEASLTHKGWLLMSLRKKF